MDPESRTTGSGEHSSRIRELAKSNRDDAFMQLMRSGPVRQHHRLYKVYQSGGWLSVHRELVEILRAAKKKRQVDRLARALNDVIRYQVEGYGLGRCVYVSANPVPKGADPDEAASYEDFLGGWFSSQATVLDETSAKFFSHYFLSASARRIPKWCLVHGLGARQRAHRQRRPLRNRSGKYI